MPELSVVVPCRAAGAGWETRWALLRLCLVALDCQTAPPGSFEVVVVDDASDNDLARRVAEFAASELSIDPRVVHNAGPVLGVSGAYNRGILAALGRYVLLTTDDSLLAPDCVAEHLAAHSASDTATYFCGIERQYLYGVLFRDITTGALHDPGDLSVRTFGRLIGLADLRWSAEQLGFLDWTIAPNDVRTRFGELHRIAALTPAFRDMYDHLGSDRRDLRWLCVRMGNHSVPRADLVALGCLDESLPGANSDQDLGLRLAVAGVEVRLQPRASSILIEHRRGLRAFADASGLARLAERWPRSDVARLHEYFARGYGRSIADYARALSAGVPQPPPATSIQSPVSSSRTEVSR